MAPLVRRRIIELSGLILIFCVIARSITLTHSSSAAAASVVSAESYLYNTIDSSPILDHGLKGNDYTKSTSPKVVEFYDPKCGACQAFKYNYIEVAKKVQATRPDVEFYGVSCALHQSICAVHGTRVPKIVVFPSADGEGVEVQKGSGAIYFLSQRLLKALRSPEEIAADSAQMKTSSRRRLEDGGGESDDEGAYGSEDFADEDAEAEADQESGETIIEEPEIPQDFTDIQPAPERIAKTEPKDSSTEVKWDPNKLVEVKGVPRDQWKPIQETDAWKNTMKELQNSESKLGAEFLKWKHEHDAKLRAQAEKEKELLDAKIAGDVKRESKTHEENKLRAQANGRKEVPPPPPKEEPKTKQIVINRDEVTPPQVFPANLPPEQEKKFKEFIEKKRQAAIRREQLKHPVKTLIGHDMKTVEQKQSNQSPMTNYKSQYAMSKSSTKDQKPKADLRPEAQQQKSTPEKILSKVPIIKRAFNKQSHAQDTLNDAALSFIQGLLMGMYKGRSRGPLEYKRKKALKDWFDLLSVSLPPEMGLHELIDTLNADIDSITASEDNLKRIVESHYIPRSKWSKSCTAEAGSLGFFCGFWKLLHIMSLGVAEQGGGLVLQESQPSIRIFSTKEAASVLREYMVHFFNCDKCVKRFVGQYDDCSFQRCSRLSDETEDQTLDGWRQFPLWLWEVHNDVSRSKANRAVEVFETRGRKAEARKFERDMRAVYPHIDQCITCFDHEGKWNVDAVYNHLEQEYWDFGHNMSPTINEMLDYGHSSSNKTSSSRGSFLSMLSIFIGAVAWLIKKQKLQVTGRHKKDEFELGSFPSANSKTKYRDS